MQNMSTDRSYQRTVAFGDQGTRHAAWQGSPDVLRLVTGSREWRVGLVRRLGWCDGRASGGANSEDRERERESVTISWGVQVRFCECEIGVV